MSAATFSWRCPACGTLVEQPVDSATIAATTPCCSTTTLSSSRGDVADVLAFVERKLDAAARSLNPVMARGDRMLPIDVDRAVHDALNSLAAIRLRVGLAAEQLADQPVS